MAGARGAFKALGPVNWDSVAAQDQKTFLTDVFSDAQCLVDSIPVAVDVSGPKTGRVRSATDFDVAAPPGRAPPSTDHARELRREWKEVKVNARENPLGLNVYKLAAKDGRGAWFARRSLHEGLTFERWKLGMEREFAESMKVQGKPGDGNIRGIGADKRVVNQTVEGCGKMQVYQLSAQFPGPTSPRDFVTLCLSSDSAMSPPAPHGAGGPKYFMVVSKPCVHSECPQRQGFIRGQYESVEFIREIKMNNPLRKVRSSIDVSQGGAFPAARTGADDLGKEAAIRSARQAAVEASSSRDESGRQRGKTISYAGADADDQEQDEQDTAIEWLMVTRSDPGGSVPRFMIERGTPAGIAGDANKFLRWISSKSIEDFTDDDHVDAKLKEEASYAEDEARAKSIPATEPSSNLIDRTTAQAQSDAGQKRVEESQEEIPGPGGFYEMIAGALGAAASAAASRIQNSFGSTQGDDTESDLSSCEASDDSSSVHSFHSFEASTEEVPAKPVEDEKTASARPNDRRTDSVQSAGSIARSSTHASSPPHQDKEMRKLEERRRKLEEKYQRAQERTRARESPSQQQQQRDEAALQKLREKHDREVAKQEDKYRREVAKLEAKRQGEQRRASERRRKQAEREDRASLAAELEKTRAERDVARRQVEVLKDQVGSLQGQNTMLVARLGREGIITSIDDIGGGGGGDGRRGSGERPRAITDEDHAAKGLSTVPCLRSRPAVVVRG
ncbi:hypothetical protein GGR56DRAFT_664041 [Xylariaceae sp. FL0804]|nr:hypothetical protein GGR56DRAFT_664041 [Xylariaceae sp. FL0804]